MKQVLSYIDKNQNRYLRELTEYISIPSISTLKSHKNEVAKCAGFVAAHLKSIGLKSVKIHKTKGHPIVTSEWKGAPGKPTVLIYGHYDVQPVDPLKLWRTDPFKAVVKDGKIWARGANDNKGQNFVHMKSVEAILKVNGKLPVNVKFILEGEEEIGSSNLSIFLKKNKKLLKCDAVMISDTSLYAPNIPTISYGLRGLCFMEVHVTGPNRDLHSGSFGGAVANPINILAEMISKLMDKRGKITIPNFYRDVVKLTKKERENFKALPFSDRAFAKELKVRELKGESGYSTIERISARPTLDCNGIIGGFTGEGAKTVLPSKASAKISMRLVPNQDPKVIAQEFKKYIMEIAPKSVKVDVKALHGGLPFYTSLDNKFVVAASKAAGKAFKKKSVFSREGGSIPIVVEFANQLKAPVILMGLGLDTDDIHSPNEHFHLSNFKRGIYASAYFLEEAGNL